MDMLDGCPPPKRGDLVQSNVGDRRERTWMVLRVRRIVRRVDAVPRFEVFAARWWEIEPDMRLRLFRSAERNGGQNVINFRRYRPKPRKRGFEQLMMRA